MKQTYPNTEDIHYRSPEAKDERRGVIYAVSIHVFVLLLMVFGLSSAPSTPNPVQVELWTEGTVPNAGEPDAQPVTEPEASEEPAVEPEPEPVPEPEPIPEPEPVPEPEPIPEPIPEPEPEPIPEPEPAVVEPPVIQPEPEPQVDPEIALEKARKEQERVAADRKSVV